MNYKQIIRLKPWLHLVNKFNISKRLLKSTKGNAFMVYNTIQQNYEVHTVQAYLLSGDSYNCTIDSKFVDGYVVYDFRANDYKIFKDEVQSQREKMNMLYDEHEKSLEDNSELTKAVERTLGTKI